MRAIASFLLLLILSASSLGCASQAVQRPRSLDSITKIDAASSDSSRNCALPKDNEAVIYSQENFKGTCRVLAQGNYPNPWHFEPVPGNSIKSMEVGRDVRLVLFASRGFAGSKSFFEGGYRYASIGGAGAQASSIAVTPGLGGRIASLYLGDHPTDRENFWSDNTQGLANDGESWFVIRGFREGDTRIYKVPLTYDLSSASQGKHPYATIPDSLKKAGYGHFGDPDRSGEFLFVPAQGPGVAPRIAVFRTKDLGYVGSKEIPKLDNSGGGWVAIRPGTNTLWVSGGAINAGRELSEYTIDWDQLHTKGTLALSFKQTVLLYDWDGVLPITIRSMQGGVFNSDGSIMYIASGFCDTVGYVHAFHIEGDKGVLQASTSNGGDAPFNYKTEPDDLVCVFGECACTSDEAEGIDWIDVAGKGVPGVPSGKLHVVLIDNDLLSKDNLFLKHYGD